MLVMMIVMMMVTKTTRRTTTRVTKTIASTKYVKINWLFIDIFRKSLKSIGFYRCFVKNVKFGFGALIGRQPRAW